MEISCYARMVFSPPLKHYCVIKTVTYKRSVRLTGPFKFKHHEIKNLTLNTTGKIVKATQELSLTIQSKHYAPPDELEATTNLKALV